MELVPGGIVTGTNLHGREVEITRIWMSIDKQSVMLTSPRRFGKTSIVHEMKRVPSNNWKLYYMDVEALRSPEDFVIALLEKIDRSNLQKIKGFFSTLKEMTEEIEALDLVRVKLRQEIKEDWQQKGKRVFQNLNEEKRVIFVLDELPTFLLNLEKDFSDSGKTIESFLQWIRDIRQSLDVRFIVCGSIGIETILAKYNLNYLVNDFDRITISPFTKDIAKEMIRKLLDNYDVKYSEKEVDAILQQIETPIPFFIQLLIKEILMLIDYGKKSLDIKTIEIAYKEGLLANGEQDFVWYEDRLKNEFEGKEYSVALKILDSLSMNPQMTQEELKSIFSSVMRTEELTEYHQIIRKLTIGYYIIQNDEMHTCSFHNKILRDLWAKKRGLQQ